MTSSSNLGSRLGGSVEALPKISSSNWEGHNLYILRSVFKSVLRWSRVKSKEEKSKQSFINVALLNVDTKVGEAEARRDANPSTFQEVQTVGKHMWGRLEVVAVKINDPVFLDHAQQKLTHTIYKLVTNTRLCD